MTHHLRKGHPVRELLEACAGGREPSRSQLDVLDRIDLPEGHSLGRFRGQVATDARKVAEMGRQGNHAHARRLAEAAWSAIAAKMSDEEAEVSETDDPTAESLTDAANRMFRR